MDLDEPFLVWDGTTPRSSVYNDIYYSPEDGLAESTFVFIHNNFLEKRFSEFAGNNFCIAETGFGTGLNFLATCKLWASKDRQQKHLDFISFEKHPLKMKDIDKALLPFNELDFFSQQLLNNYPKLISGFHRLHFSHNISLTLYFGDALEGLRKLNKQTQVDAWYFDGFSPQQNESLWSEELFELCKEFNSTNTTFSTFTAAGHVRRKLSSSGFSCEKVKGFGIKREMLRGHFTEEMQSPTELSYSFKPWLRTNKKHKNTRPKSVAVIGCGLAGSWTAYKLAAKGVHIDIFDSASEIAAGASGNPRGATYFKLNKETGANNSFYLNAYLYAIRELDNLQVEQSIWDKSGLIQLLTESDSISEVICNHEKIARPLTVEECTTVSGIKQSYPGVYFPDAGSVNPKALCELLVNQKNINLHLNSEIQKITHIDKSKTWSVKRVHEGLSKETEYSSIVIANSYAANSFEQCAQLPLFEVRGQSTQLTSNSESKNLKTIICSKGYLTPSINEQHTIGSTFDPRNKSTEITAEDNQRNINYLKIYTPDFYTKLEDIKIISAKAALRCQTPDMLPIVGLLPDYQQFKTDYADISKGQLKKNYPFAKYLPNLYINVGHASRGLISAPYCAEILVNEMLGEVSACEQDVSDSLAAARFYLRLIKKIIKYLLEVTTYINLNENRSTAQIN